MKETTAWDNLTKEQLDGRIAQEHKKLIIAEHEGLHGDELLKMEENLRKMIKEARSRK